MKISVYPQVPIDVNQFLPDDKYDMEKIRTQVSLYARSLIDVSLDPLIIVSVDGKITDMNQAAMSITGLTREQLTGTDFDNYFTEPQKVREVYSGVFANGFVSGVPLTLLHKEGKMTDVLFNGSVYKDDKSNAISAVIVVRDISGQKWATELGIANKELAFQIDEKGKRAEELILANQELALHNEEKEKRAEELILANEELAFHNEEKEKRAEELIIANKELAFQNDEKEKRAAELIIANKALAFQNNEKEKRAEELIHANKELAFQNDEKEKRAAELIVANKELAFQNKEKEKRAKELIIANKELAFQNKEKEKRAAELVVTDRELLYQIREKQKQEFSNIELEAVTENLKLTAHYSRSLIEASHDPLVTINPEGKITDMNEALTFITGFARNELTGTDFLDYFTKPQKASEVYQEIFAKGYVSDAPLTLRHKNGKLTDVLFNGSVYKDDKENVLGVVVVARDMTYQKGIESDLTEAIVFAELATEIAEKAKRKAEEATRIAEGAVKGKQQFLSNMSHEIRTPMNAIIGFTKVLLKTDLSSKQKEYLEAIKISGDALIVLINDILDLAKVDSGKMVFEEVPFKVASSISAMIHLFETKINEKNLKLDKEYDKRIPEMLIGDPVRLHQIILNLISNAVKFTTKGKITVRVHLVSENEEQATVEFSVTDTGIGIAEDKTDKIFEYFHQASSSTSRLYGGTGLGLAIVKQLVESQGGSINVKSKIDEGSTFSFMLSFQKTKIKEESVAESVEPDSDIKNIKVLVAEDIALNQLLMRTVLDEFGFECDIADNGRIAIEKLQNKSYDVILMDLQMPEMNGFEATEHIRSIMKSNIPIIALTADVTTVDLAKCTSVGMNDYIAKPVDERILYQKIVEQIKKTSKTGKGPKQRCIDLTYLIKRTKANSALMKEMISLYLEQTPPLIQAMKSGMQDKDWDSLRSSVHKMIPSFAIMGISKEYEDMAKKIQEQTRELNPPDEIEGLVFQLENICNQACSELEEELLIIKKAS